MRPATAAALALLVVLAGAAAADPPGGKDGRDARPAPHPAPPPAARTVPAPPAHPAAPAAPGTPAATLPAIVPNSVVDTIVTSCWMDRRWFWSFTSGNVDFCRGHLDYVPGALDCYSYNQEICSLYTQTTGEWSESVRTLPPALFACPDDVEPPVCPRMR